MGSSLILVLSAESEPGTVVGLSLPSPPVLDLEPAEVRATLHHLDVPHTVKFATPERAGKDRSSSIKRIQPGRPKPFRFWKSTRVGSLECHVPECLSRTHHAVILGSVGVVYCYRRRSGPSCMCIPTHGSPLINSRPQHIYCTLCLIQLSFEMYRGGSNSLHSTQTNNCNSAFSPFFC